MKEEHRLQDAAQVSRLCSLYLMDQTRGFGKELENHCHKHGIQNPTEPRS